MLILLRSKLAFLNRVGNGLVLAIKVIGLAFGSWGLLLVCYHLNHQGYWPAFIGYMAWAGTDLGLLTLTNPVTGLPDPLPGHRLWVGSFPVVSDHPPASVCASV